jgi:hypothetical protein
MEGAGEGGFGLTWLVSVTQSSSESHTAAVRKEHSVRFFSPGDGLSCQCAHCGCFVQPSQHSWIWPSGVVAFVLNLPKCVDLVGFEKHSPCLWPLHAAF